MHLTRSRLLCLSTPLTHALAHRTYIGMLIDNEILSILRIRDLLLLLLLKLFFFSGVEQTFARARALLDFSDKIYDVHELYDVYASLTEI